MPWFEPSSRAPRCGGPRNNNNNIINDGEEEEWSDGQQNNNRRNNYRSGNDYHHEQEIISLHDYLDLNWQHVSNSEDNNEVGDDNNYSATRTATAARQRRVNFDGFQHRVEHQLGSAVVPASFAASFAGLNSSLYHTATNYNNSSNNSSSHHQLLFSKTAQFFHPRQVLALRQYEGLFSPLDASAAQHSDDCHESLRQINTTNNDNNNDNGGGGEHSSTNLHTILQPRNLFHSSQSQNHIQATLRQDPTTGQLLAATSSGSSEHHHHSGGNNKTSSWDNYGGRPQMFDGSNVHGPVVNEENENNNSKKKKKATKKKKKDKSKGKSGEDKNEQQQQQRIDSMFQSKMGADGNDTTHGGGNDNNDTKKKKSNKMTKKKKRSYLDHETSCELTIPTNNQVDKDDNNMLLSTTTTTNRTLQTSSNSTTTTTPTLAEEDFEGMSNILNAAQCMEGLQQFLSRVGEVTYVAWTMIFLDPLCHYRQYYGVTANNDSSTGGKRRKRSKKFALKNTNDSAAAATMLLECTTPFLPSNKRYCTDKGPTCTAWNCTCDDQIRAMRGGAPLLGAMFVLDMRDEEGVGGSGCGAEGGRGEKECYLLPLGPTEKCLDGGLEAGYSRMKSWPVIPFDCDVSLSDRWR